MNSSINISEAKLLLTVEETASILSLGRSKVYDLIARGEIPSLKIHGSRRVPLNQLASWIDNQVTSTSQWGGR